MIGTDWTPEQDKLLIAARALYMPLARIAEEYFPDRTVASIRCRLERLGVVVRQSVNAPAPPDFREAADMTNQEAAERWGVSVNIVQRWRRETGVAFAKALLRPLPHDFAEQAARMTRKGLAAHYGAGHSTISRFYELSGTKPLAAKEVNRLHSRDVPKPVKAAPGPAPAPLARPEPRYCPRTAIIATRAVRDCLSRVSPIWRCHADGRPDPAGRCWRRGSAILTDDEVIERAESLGWSAQGRRAA